jgi:beta-hydroxyacyl-ACP dehydratase FabZ
MDIQTILKRLPHRYPMVMIDRIIELVPGEKIIALKNVTINEPFFSGHFPSIPIMPGVLIVEAMGQAGGILTTSQMPADSPLDRVYFLGFDKVRFRKPVVPGDQLVLEVRMLKQRLKTVKMAGRAVVDEKLVAEAEFLAAYGETA